MPVQQLPYDGPPLSFLTSGRQVKFCSSREDVKYHYVTVPQETDGPSNPVPEYAACLQGPLGAGIVRARVNTTGVAYGCEPITFFVTFCVPDTRLSWHNLHGLHQCCILLIEVLKLRFCSCL